MNDPTGNQPVSQLPAHLLESVLEQSYNAILITDADLSPDGQRIVYVNQAFCRMTGYSREEIIGKTPRILQGPLTNREVIADLRDCLRTGRPFSGSAINYRKDGSTYGVEWNISPIRNQVTGELTHFVSVQQDVSILIESQGTCELLSQVLDTTEDGIMITNEKGMIEYVNRGFQEITGYSVTEVVGKTPKVLESGKHPPEFYEQMWQELESEQHFRATFINRAKSGELIYCDSTVSAVISSDGRVRKYFMSFKDLTERVEKEHHLWALASSDSLTGLMNRRAGERFLEKIYLSTHDKGLSFCLLMLDIDHFKKINDTYGHSVGDLALKAAADLIRASVRVTDGIIRWGGEEFLVILPHCKLAVGMRQAERIRSRIENHRAQDHPPMTVSIGVTESDPAVPLEMLIEQADRALYRAKKLGRNRVMQHATSDALVP